MRAVDRRTPRRRGKLAGPEREQRAPEPSYGLRQRTGLLLGPVVFTALLLLPVPAGMEVAAWRTAAVGALMAVWWISEAIPIPATALLPLVLLPALGVSGIEGAAAPYANPVIFLFLGGFMMPVATPPNAIVYGSSFITIPQMARAGLVLNLLFIFVVSLLGYLLVLLVFGAQAGVVPGWAE